MTANVLYIDPDLSGRLRFKQVARSATLESITAINTLIEGLERLESKRTYDIVFLSTRFSREVLGQFISAARRTVNGGRACYMAVMSSSSSGINDLAEYAMVGADGFLLEPYSAESLSQSVSIAETLKTKKTITTQILSIELLVKATIENFSAFTKAIKQQHGIVSARDHLRRTRTLVAKLKPEQQDRFRELLLTRLMLRHPESQRSAVTPPKGFMPSGRRQRSSAV